MTNFRALCAELFLFAEQAGEICHNEGLWPDCDQQPICVDGKPLWLLDRVRAALAEPEPEGPTDEEILELSQWHEVSYTLINGDVVYPMQEETDMRDAVLSFTRAVLARWGNHPGSPDSSLQPIPVSERMPEPEDCNSEEKAMRPQQQQEEES